MKAGLLGAVVVIVSGGMARAQWASDPNINFSVADGVSDQAQPKIAATSDGGCFISWYDGIANGYDPRLQRLDGAGVEQWAHNGIRLKDTTNTSTVDYDLMVDAAGNALVTFKDNSSGTNQITATKVSPSGVELWGAGGVTVSSGAVDKNNPHITELSDGSIMVGWSESPGFRMQRLDANGALVGANTTISEAGRTVSLSDLQAGDNGSVIALWIRPFNTSFTSAKYLYTQKYDAAFTAMWPLTPGSAAVVVYGPAPGSPWPTGVGTYGTQGGSVQNGYFPGFIPDGNGGAVYGWYENAGPRNAYVQHVLADGTLKFAANGITNAQTPTSRIRISAGLAFDRGTGEYFLSSVECDASPQTNYRTFVQKYTSAGALAWGGTGVEIVPVNGNQQSFVQTVSTGGGACMVFGFDSRPPTSHVLFGGGVSDEGSLLWTNEPSPTVETKSRLFSAWGAGGFAILAFGGNRLGDQDIYVQNVKLDGTFGPMGPACDADVNCDGSINGFDIEATEQAVNGDFSNFCQATADLNGDGAENGFDIETEEQRVNGAPC